MASLEKLWKCFVILVTQKEPGGTAFDTVITRIRGGRCKFRDLVPLLSSRALPLGAKVRLYSAFVRRVCYLEVRLD